MRIPGVDYRRPVQSLGREDIMAPQRLAALQGDLARGEGAGLRVMSRALGDLGTTFEQLEKQEAVDQYNEAWAQAQADIITASASVNSGPMLSRSENPDIENLGLDFTRTVTDPNGGTAVEEVDTVPAFQVSQQLLQQRLDDIYEAHRSNITNPRALRKFDAEYAEARARAEAAQFKKANEQRIEYQRSKVDLTLRLYERQLDEVGAKAYLKQAVAMGMITPVEAGERWMDIEANIDRNEALQTLATGSYDEVNALRANPEALRMSFEERKELAGMAQAEMDRREAEEKAAQDEREEAAARQALQGVIEGRLGEEDLLAMAHRMKPSDLLTATNLVETRAQRLDAQTDRDLTFRSTFSRRFWMSEITSGLRPGDQPTQWARDMRARLVSDGNLNNADLTTLLSQVDEASRRPTRSPEYFEVMNNLSLLINKVSYDNLGAGGAAETSGIFLFATEQFHDFIRREGEGANLLAWYEEHRAEFLTAVGADNYNSARYHPDLARYVVPNATGEMDTDATREALTTKLAAARASREQTVRAGGTTGREDSMIRRLERGLRALDDLTR